MHFKTATHLLLGVVAVFITISTVVHAIPVSPSLSESDMEVRSDVHGRAPGERVVRVEWTGTQPQFSNPGDPQITKTTAEHLFQNVIYPHVQAQFNIPQQAIQFSGNNPWEAQAGSSKTYEAKFKCTVVKDTHTWELPGNMVLRLSYGRAYSLSITMTDSASGKSITAVGQGTL